MKKSFWITLAIMGAALVIFLSIRPFLFGNWTNVGWGMGGGWPAGTMHGLSFGSLGWFGMILMWIIPIGFIVLVVLGIVGFVRGFSSRDRSAIIHQPEVSQTSPREILRIRYANGEITRDQYLQMLNDIE